MEFFIIPSIIGAAVIVIKGLKIYENSTKKAFSRSSTKISHAKNIVHNEESAGN
jgi:hypothetical protein